MKNALLILTAALSIVTIGENAILKQELEDQAKRYESKLEVQKAEYIDEIVEVKQKLRAKTFELDMATNHIELLNSAH